MSDHQVMQKGQLLVVFSVACVRTNDILIHVVLIGGNTTIACQFLEG